MTAGQRAQVEYEDAKAGCYFQHRQEEAKQRAEVGNDVAADEALQVCLDKAEADRTGGVTDRQAHSQPLPRLKP